MFKAVISQANLQAILSSVSHLIDECKMIISENGIKIEAVDPANVCVVRLNAPVESFDFYQATDGEIAIDLNKLSTMSAGKENVSLEMVDDNHKLSIKMGKSSYLMSLIDPTAVRATPRIPELEMPCIVTMKSTDFVEAIKSSLKVSDEEITLAHDSENFIFSVIDAAATFDMKLPLSELVNVRSGEGKSRFSLDYLEGISKTVAKAKDVTVSIGIDYPAMIDFNLGSGISVKYILAPRMES